MKRILVIEDEQDMREALLMKLTQKGYRVETAENAEIGLSCIKTAMPDLILLDMITPSMHGALFLERLRELPEGKDCPVIVLTNIDNDTLREKADTLGVKAYLEKTEVTLDAVATKVGEVIGI